jgi:hypothetical protein
MLPQGGQNEGDAHNAGGEEGAAVVGVEDADQGKCKDADGHGQDLAARAHARAEQRQVRREAEHVPVDILPPRLLLVLPCAQPELH